MSLHSGYLVRNEDIDDARFREWMRSLITKMLLGFGKYFSKDCVLNSDGRRLLEEILKPVVRRYPHLKGIARNVRKEPTLENILKLASIFMSEDEAEELAREGMRESTLR